MERENGVDGGGGVVDQCDILATPPDRGTDGVRRAANGGGEFGGYEQGRRRLHAAAPFILFSQNFERRRAVGAVVDDEF